MAGGRADSAHSRIESAVSAGRERTESGKVAKRLPSTQSLRSCARRAMAGEMEEMALCAAERLTRLPRWPTSSPMSVIMLSSTMSDCRPGARQTEGGMRSSLLLASERLWSDESDATPSCTSRISLQLRCSLTTFLVNTSSGTSLSFMDMSCSVPSSPAACRARR